MFNAVRTAALALACAVFCAAFSDAQSQPSPEPAPDTAAPAEPSTAPTPAQPSAAPTPAEPSTAPSLGEDHHVLETKIEALAPTSAASAQTIRDRDLVLRPHATPEDILRAVPGLVIAQHQGGGKADQLFLRGFDADHGTDVSLFIDGVPINMPSHGHGQGFADLHFLIPEAINQMDVTKGPYFPEYGDFDTAGAINLKTRRSFGESSISGSYGSFNTYRVLGIASPKLSEGLPWLAAEVAGTNGPFISPEELQRYNLMGKETLALNASTVFSLLVSAYGSQWSASGQIPLRAVKAGYLDRFGSIDPTEGGQTQRQMLIATLENKRGSEGSFSLTAYAVRYRFRLFSDFTFQLRDPENFDQIEQNDSRFYTGVAGRFKTSASLNEMRFITTLGAQARFDDIHTNLWHDKQRNRLADCFENGANPCNDAQIQQSDIGVYFEEDARLTPWLRIVVGVRADLFEFNVTDQKPLQVPAPDQPTTGIVQKSIVNPKLQIVLRPTHWWDIYLDGGGGFHSNDARGVIASGGSGALPRAWGAEIGTRLFLGKVDLAAAGWYLHLQSEQVFNPDEDSTSPSDPTRRYGLDLEARWQILPWLWADGDLSLSKATYTVDRGNGSAVALAPTRVAALGITALHPEGYKARIGLRHVGSRPATQDESLTAEGYTLVDLSLGYRHRFWELGLVIENLLDSSWREAQFANDSQLRIAPYNEAEPVTDIHFTPGNPINVRATLALYF
ncbi:MAG TPA: TonB-dependent receptor [Myxococcaceae bacterium]|nr:TonB-dependent receptor [Myxococcaceae bacterium]